MGAPTRLVVHLECGATGEEALTPVVSTPMQMWSLMAVGCISGAFYGYLFGYIDVEDDDAFHDRFKEQATPRVPRPGGLSCSPVPRRCSASL